ncbi:MAG TPA: GntR family transcriptional regulator [Baekduia sp.]|uniref:FadR/GntR family transcriptional regulator n=1 Tax=Baekduia sp. TaxID=2600305 RepID=UPI002D7976B0|nr:GntR family transcriptional regulator [Baekduia sp.]HET6506571.1 GntR family transcriptional regulator [Baekduia sp.]
MPVERSNVPEQVFRQLVAAVLEGRYEAGERLPPQRALAQDLGVNMASLREGIKRLEQLRLVEVRHGDAMRVTDWKTTAGLDVLAHAVADDPALTGPLFEARRLLLREAARLAAQRRTDGHVKALDSLADGVANAPDDAAAQMADLMFMATIIDASDNLIFSLILNSIRELYLSQLDRFAPLVADRDELIPLYRRAAKAIADGSAARAATAIERLAAEQEARMVGTP